MVKFRMGREILIATISTAVPFITILIGMLMNNKRFDAMDKRFDAVEKRVEHRFELVDRRFEAVDRRFDAVDRRFDAMDAHLSRIDADLRQFYHLTGVMEGKVGLLEKKLG
jgi:tetrahydromethanopterin S-methyltransferase subunit G